MHPRDPSPRVAIAIGVIALAAVFASVLPQLRENTWIFRDGRFYVNVATTIVEDLSLDQREFAASWYTGTLGWNRDLDPGWSNIALGARGEHWPKHPWILPLLASPLYFAFGLPGTLAWNLLMFALIASGLYRFARAYARPAHAAPAAALFVLGTALMHHAYDFSVDVLMLALFAQGLAAVLAGRGVLAGVCIALCVVIKPTALMLMPALLLTIAERRHRATLVRSLAAGAAVLATYGGINWWMYGRPWWSGYNRTLVTEGGRPVVADHVDAFGVPFAEGFTRMWSGHYGLVHSFTAMVLAAPGLLVLLRRRPLHAVGAVLGVAASLLVFAKYAYEGHRFHWPALALLVPAIAVGFELVTDVAARVAARARTIAASSSASGLAAALAIVGGAAVTLPFGPTLVQRVLETGAYGERALEVMRAIGLDERAGALVVVIVHLALAALYASRLVALLERLVPSPVAGFAVAACALMPGVREACVAGGPVLVASTLLALAVERACAGRLRVAGACAVLFAAAWAFAPQRGGQGASALVELARALGEPSEIRVLAPWVALALFGLAVAVRRDGRAALALGALALFSAWPGVGVRGGAWAPATVVAFAGPAAVAADAIASAVARATRGWDGRRVAMATGALVLVLLSIGGVRRAIAAREPFHIASFAGVRRAVVLLERPGAEPVPCDFLAWEHLSWECSHFDAGLYGMAGLAVSDPPRVGGERARLFLVPSGRWGHARRVIWPAARAGSELVLRWAVPDELRGGGELVVRVDEREVGRVEVPASGDGTVHEIVLATPGVGETARLELEMVATGRWQAVVGVDAEWR